MLALGFSISAFTLYAALSLAAHSLAAHSLAALSLMGDGAIAGAGARAAVWLAAGGMLAVLLARDALHARAVCVLGPSWRRQTPKRYLDRWGVTTAAFVWGLDTGLVFTTFRVTSLSWAALIVTGLGLVPWWAGAAYALGFVIPLLVSILAFGKRTDPSGETDPEPGWLVHRLFRYRPALRLLALATLGTAGAGCLATAMLRLG